MQEIKPGQETPEGHILLALNPEDLVFVTDALRRVGVAVRNVALRAQLEEGEAFDTIHQKALAELATSVESRAGWLMRFLPDQEASAGYRLARSKVAPGPEAEPQPSDADSA